MKWVNSFLSIRYELESSKTKSTCYNISKSAHIPAACLPVVQRLMMPLTNRKERKKKTTPTFVIYVVH